MSVIFILSYITDQLLLRNFLPMVVSMTFNQPKNFWNMKYTEQLELFFSLTEPEEQLVRLSSSLIIIEFSLLMVWK